MQISTTTDPRNDWCGFTRSEDSPISGVVDAMIVGRESRTLVIGELKPKSGGNWQLLAPLITTHRRSGVCPVGITATEYTLSVFTLKSFSNGVYRFTKAMYCVRILDEVLDHMCDQAGQVEVQYPTLHSRMASMSLEEVVEGGSAARGEDSVLRRLQDSVTSLSGHISVLTDKCAAVDAKIDKLETAVAAKLARLETAVTERISGLECTLDTLQHTEDRR